MPRIAVSFGEEGETLTSEGVEEAVDQEIEDFAAWFSGLGNDDLTRFERAIIKSYFAYKWRLKEDGKAAS